MKLSNTKDIFFDLDHTLWDFDKNSALTFEAIFREEKLEVNLEEFLNVYIPINNNYWKLYREDKVTKEALRIGRLKDCFDNMQLDVPAAILDNLSLNYIKFLPNYTNLLEDTIDVLEYLSQRYRLHIITNGFEEVQNAKIENSKISDFFSTVTTSEEAGVKKPHIKIFQLALEKAGALPHQSLMVGDNYEADIEGALNAGIPSIYFNYYKQKEKVQSPAIQKLNELKLFL